MSTLETNLVQPSTGTTLTLGASGDTVALGTGASLSGFGDNTPGFHANRSSDQGILDATYTLVYFDSETYDSDSAYDTSTGRFTVPSGEGGKYVVYSWCCVSSNQGTTSNDINEMHVLLKKNGSNAATVEWDPNGYGNKMVLGFNVTLDLSASDYLEVFVWMDSATGSNCTVLGDAYPRSYFGAYKLIGV
tara:strand:- start:29441 stop:30010 length:570 start_codon:yes stop_codon:yes gene_type:complete